MKNGKGDRRSQRTRQLLANALIELMLKKSYDQVTVQEIIERANVGRSTFYAHYQDKEDLLLQELERAMDVFSQPVAIGSEAGGPPQLRTLELFRHIQSQHHLYKALSGARGVGSLFSKGQAFLSRGIEAYLAATAPADRPGEIPLAVTANYAAGALLTLLHWWLDHKMPYSPERMDEMFQRLVMPGVRAALATRA